MLPALTEGDSEPCSQMNWKDPEYERGKMRIYKICRERDGQHVSAVIGKLEGVKKEWEVVYIPNIPTYPNKEGSLLMAFKWAADAKEFLSDLEDKTKYTLKYTLWMANGRKVKNIFRIVTDLPSNLNVLSLFWDTKGASPSSSFLIPPPRGTVGCKSITLKKQVNKR